jgi:hypothetical protein
VGQEQKKPRPGTILSGRNARRIGAAGLLGLLGFAAIAAYAVYSTVPGRIQVAPVSLVVHSAGALPAEVRALETATAPLLFDRDTRSAHIAYAEQRIDASLERPTEIRAIKVYGAAPYELTVAALQNGSWTPIPGLTKLSRPTVRKTSATPIPPVFSPNSRGIIRSTKQNQQKSGKNPSVN